MRHPIVLLVTTAALTSCIDTSGIEIMPLQDRQVRVNETLVLELRLSKPLIDVEWYVLSPTIPDLDEGAQMFQSGSAATFRWSPLATHAGTHAITFTAASGIVSDSMTVTVEVLQAGGAPRFIQPPPGGTFDMTRSSEVLVPVEVLDEDDVSVQIRQVEPVIQGGTLEQTGAFSAQFRWQPSASQVDASLRYVLRLEADDGVHAPVRTDFDIVLLTEARSDCAGAPPVIVAVDAPARLETVRDYTLAATVTDDQGLKHDPVLYYSTEAPSDPASPDLTAMHTVSFASVGADVYEASVPNLGLDPGVERVVFFTIVVTDDDDASGTACDHTTRAPLRQLVAVGTSEVDVAGYCDPCSNDAQCGAGLCVAGGSGSFCGAGCDGVCPVGAECREVTGRGGTVREQCVPAEGASCRGGGGAGGPCTPDGYEPSSDSAASAPSIAVGAAVRGTICADDADHYAVTLNPGTRYRFTVGGWDPSTADIDVELLGPSGDVVAASQGTTDEEVFEACVGVADRYVVRVYPYEGSGSYSLEVDAVGATCCADDGHEDDDRPSEANPLTCGSAEDGQICDWDEDWWSITVTGPSTIAVDLSCDPSAGDLDLRLYGPDGATILGSDLSTACDSHVAVSLHAAGTYLARVQGWGEASGGYRIDCSRSAGATCTTSSECAAGQVCDPGVGCVDGSCDVGGCPGAALCVDRGGSASSSTCVEPCGGSGGCAAGQACKVFEGGRGCAETGSGQTGQPCADFADCAGERVCLTAGSTGYCAEIDCSTSADCPMDDHTGRPTQSACVDVGGGRRVCLMDCYDSDSLCDFTAGSCMGTTDVGGAVVWVCALSSHATP